MRWLGSKPPLEVPVVINEDIFCQINVPIINISFYNYKMHLSSLTIDLCIVYQMGDMRRWRPEQQVNVNFIFVFLTLFIEARAKYTFVAILKKEAGAKYIFFLLNKVEKCDILIFPSNLFLALLIDPVAKCDIQIFPRNLSLAFLIDPFAKC